MTIRWGIVTAGYISNDFVNAINSYPEIGDMIIAAVAARNKDRAAEFAKKHNIQHVFDSYQALALSNAVDVVYIGALNPDHYCLCKMFLENGKHVLCEKPLCLNFKQAQSLVNLAKKKHLFLMEGVWSRFSPAYIALEKEIQAGELGDVKFLEANFGVPIEGVDRLSKKSLGGSALMDIGIYPLQFAQYVFKDEPERVTTVGELNSEGVDVAETIILEYSGGRKAVLNVDTKVFLLNNATVVGTKGRATLKYCINFPVELIHVNGETEKFPLHESPMPFVFSKIAAGLAYEAVEVARCIREGLLESPRMSHAESLLLARLEDTIRKQLGVHYDVDDLEFS